MLNFVSLNNKNLGKLSHLNDLRKQFNNLNEDFCEYYNNISILKQFFLRKNIKLLDCSGDIIGYIWTTKCNKESYVINSMYVNGLDNPLEKYNFMLNSLKIKNTLIYNCEKNSYNYDILKSLGFSKMHGTLEMHAKVNVYKYDTLDNDLTFQVLKKGEHEEIRCRIQNEVFKDDDRLSLTIEDMYYDESQSYYFEEGAIFLKKGDEYIGYGQIIINGKVPTIVNVGILKEYRGRGYGKILMIHLLRILNDNGFNEVNLKVSSDNYIALNLYKSLGFTLEKEIHRWEYKWEYKK